MLEAWHLYCDHGSVDMFLKRVSPIVEYGDQFARLHQTSTIKKGVSNLRETRPSSYSSNGMHKEKVYS
jgi:hypothetical protein